MSNRRTFLKTLGLGSASLVLGVSAKAATEVINMSADPLHLALEINPFIVIQPSGQITLINPRPDMGQGSTQAVPSLLAEELEVRLDQVTIAQSDGRSKYGSQLSGGSSSVRELWMPIRKAGAAAKEMLIAAAAQRWNVPVSECYAQDAKVFHKPSGKSLTYGEVADDASKFEVPKNPTLKEPKDFKIIGKYAPRLDVPSRITGKAVFGIDVEVPNMVYAAMIHCPAVHGKIVAIDDSEALKIKGVQKVMRCERSMPHRSSEAVAIVADSYWAALSAKKAVKVTWDNAGYETMTTDAYFKAAYAAAKTEGIKAEETGNVAETVGKAAKKLEATYETPFLAHAPLEPENATVHVKSDGSVEIWAPVQGPDGAIADVTKYLGIKPEQVKINVTLLGGAFGRKAYHDFLLEACYIAKEIKKPVKLIWTREDDLTQGPYRPGMVAQMQGAIDEKNNLTAYHHHTIGESIQGQVFKMLKDGAADDWICGELGAQENKYGFSASKISFSHVKTDIPIVWWRSVYASNFGFSQEGFFDEMAHAAGKDTLKARLELLTDDRYKKVLETIAEKANWGQKLPAGHGRGLAMFKSFGSISACCITVSKQGAGVKIEKVVSVIDCGYYVNPDNVKAQTEGNIVMGLTAAIKKGITFNNGQAEQTNYHQYQIMRFNEMPPVEIHLIDSGAAPGGVGEPGLPPVAPALTNAIFAATGKRIRRLPFDLTNLG